MKTVQYLIRLHITMTLVIFVSGFVSMPALAADPGQPFPSKSEVNDQKAGSLLFFNYYTSSGCCPSQENTRINITNTNPSVSVMLHLFFVDGSTCAVADSYLPLVRNQTTSFALSEIDPGVMGYLVAVAVDGPPGFSGGTNTNGTNIGGTNTGKPISFNFVIGDEYVELGSGHQAALGAEAFAVVDRSTPDPTNGPNPPYTSGEPTATLTFNGTAGNYNRVPQMLVLSSMPSPADSIAGYNTQLILNRIGGSLVGNALPLGPIFGLLYNDACLQASFTFNALSCQFRSQINRNFPRTTPRPNQFIPEGRTGWSKFYSTEQNVGILGAVMVTNNTGSSLSLGVETLNGGRNLHKLRLAETVTYTIPVFPAN